MRTPVVALILLAAPVAVAKDATPITIVVCAPGYPGTTAEAQPTMDAFAAAVARATALPAEGVKAIYEASDKAGTARISAPDAAAALVTLPFFLAHGEELKLTPKLQVETKDSGAGEVWSLVAKKGRVTSPAALAGFTVYSIAGYAPGFVRGALGEWGKVPETAKVVESAQVLSSLRKAASGANVAVLLDGAQGAALPSLPFAGELEVVARSRKFPSAVVASVGDRLPLAVEKGLLKLSADPQAATVLTTIRLTRFSPLDSEALAAAQRAAGVGK